MKIGIIARAGRAWRTRSSFLRQRSVAYQSRHLLSPIVAKFIEKWPRADKHLNLTGAFLAAEARR